MKKIIIVVLVVVVLFGLASLAYRIGPVSEATGPAEMVEAFYTGWISQEGGLAARTYRDSRVVSSTLSAKLDALIAEMEGGAYDPILCAQDKPSAITVSLGAVTAGTAEVIISEDFGGMAQELKVGTVKADQGWQIESITCPAPQSFDFEKVGNLVKDNPGLEPGVWYLVFDEPGSPASQTQLLFAENSICATGIENNTCNPEELEIGGRVKVVGQSADGAVHVSRLEQ